MKRTWGPIFSRPRGALLAALLLSLIASSGAARAEHPAVAPATLDTSYQIGDGGAAAPSGPSADQGPVRLARFSYVRGNVTWRPGEGASWSPASVNLPIRQGAQVWVTDGGRAEIQFDDGALLRLGSGAIVTLQTLYSDAGGEFTELQMNEGVSALRLTHAASLYQVDTPLASIKSEGPAKVRIGVDDSVEVAVRGGSAAVEGDGRKTVLRAGDYLNLSDAEASYQVGPIPDPDDWDAWNDARDRQLADAASASYLPPNITLVAGDLDDYGAWRDDPQYGHVWCPRHVDADWRPYEHGRWVWVDPFGWTWVSSEEWGWAPYHYGTWVEASYGWAWVPGPAHQYWCPAVVHFSEYNGAVAWCPLAPREVHYPPALSLGFHGGGFSLNFSIGGCAVYYPAGGNSCAPRPFNNVVVNRTVYVNRVTNVYNNINVTNVYTHNSVHNHNTYLTDNRFVPENARNAAGVTTASVAAFGGNGAYQPQPRGAAAFFARGRGIGAPTGGQPVAGPVSARPTAQSYTPSRTFLAAARPPREFTQRPVFRGSLPARVARFAPPLPHPQTAALLRRNGPPSPGAQPERRIGGTPPPFGGGGPAQQRALAARQTFGQGEQARPGQGRPGSPRPFFGGNPAPQRQPAARQTFGQVRQGGPQGDGFGIQGQRRTFNAGERPQSTPTPHAYHYNEASRLDVRPQFRPARGPAAPRPGNTRGRGDHGGGHQKNDSGAGRQPSH